MKRIQDIKKMKKQNLILSIFLMIILLSTFASATWIEVEGPEDAIFGRAADGTSYSGTVVAPMLNGWFTTGTIDDNWDTGGGYWQSHSTNSFSHEGRAHTIVWYKQDISAYDGYTKRMRAKLSNQVTTIEGTKDIINCDAYSYVYAAVPFITYVTDSNNYHHQQYTTSQLYCSNSDITVSCPSTGHYYSDCSVGYGVNLGASWVDTTTNLVTNMPSVIGDEPGEDEYTIYNSHNFYGSSIEINVDCDSGDCCETATYSFKPAQTLATWYTCSGTNIIESTRTCSGSSSTSTTSSSTYDTAQGCEVCSQTGSPETSTASFVARTDTATPVITSPTEGSWVTSDPDATYTKESCFDTCKYSRNGGAWTAMTCGTSFDPGDFGTEGTGKTIKVQTSDSVTALSKESTLRTFNLDETNPIIGTPSIDSASMYTKISGTTLYYKPTGSSETFSIDVDLTDALSDIDYITWPTMTGIIDLGGDVTGNTYSNDFGFSSVSTFDGIANIVGYDNSGRSATTSITVRRDASPPTGFSLTYFDGITDDLTQTISKNLGSRTDSISGVDDSTFMLQVQNATYTSVDYEEGVCGTYGSWTTLDTAISSSYLEIYPGVNPSSPYNGYCYKYRLLLSDNVNNQGDSTSGSIIKIDNADPIMSSTLTNNAGYYVDDTWSASYIDVLLQCSDPQSGCAGIYYCIDTTNECTPSIFIAGDLSYQETTEGQAYVRFYAQDNFGQQSTLESISFKIDTSDPIASITDPATDNNWTDSLTYPVTYTATDGSADSCWYTIDGGITTTNMTCGTDLTITGPWVGPIETLTIYVNDSFNNVASATRTFNIDTIDPVLTIDSSSTLAGYSYNDYIDVNVFVIEENIKELKFELYDELDTIISTEIPLVSESYLFPLEDDDLELWLDMDDINANDEPIDLSGTNSDITLENYGTDNPYTVGQVGNSLMVNGTAPIRKAIVDFDGSIDMSTGLTMCSWINPSIDTTALQGIITFSPNLGLFKDTTDDYTFRVTPIGGSFNKVSIDKTDIPENEWHYLCGVWDGEQKIYLDGVLKNTSTIITTAETMSETTLTIGSLYTFRDFPFTGKLDEVIIIDRGLSADEIIYLKDSESIKGFKHTFTGLNEGSYYYKATITDEADSIDQETSGTILIDLYNPEVSITSPPTDDLWYLSDPSIESTITDTYLDSCWWTRNNGVTNTSISCASSITGQTWSQGPNEVTIYANDDSGREGYASRSFSKDTIAPIGEVSYADGNYISTTQQVYLKVNQGGIYDIGLDISSIQLEQRTTNLIAPGNCNSAGWSVWSEIIKNGCSETTGISGYYECSHSETISSGLCYQYRVYATDLVGNNDYYTSTNVTEVDTGGPTIIITDPISGQYYTTGQTVEWTATDDNLDECWYSINEGVTNISITCDSDIAGIFSEGRNYITVYAIDTLSNLGFNNMLWWEDTNSPIVSYGSATKAQGTYSEDFIYASMDISEICPKNISIRLYNSSETITTHNEDITSCYVGEGDRSGTTTISYNFTGLDTGTYMIDAIVYDNAERVSTFSDSIRTYILDGTSPVVSISAPNTDGLWYEIQVPITWSVVDDNLDSCWYTIDNGITNTSITCNSIISSETWSEGTNLITIYSKDTFNNYGSASRQFNVDTLNPVIQINSNTTSGATLEQDWIYISTDITEENIDTVAISLYRNDILIETQVSSLNNFAYNFTDLYEGVYNYTVSVFDQVGNEVSVSGTNMDMDESPPDLIRVFPPSNGMHYSEDIDIEYTVSDKNLNSCKYRINSGSWIDTTCGDDITSSFIEGINNIDIYSDDTIGNENTININFIKDTTQPTILVINPSLDNTSEYYDITRIQFDIQFSDFNLFGYNITCEDKSTGNIEHSVQVEDLTSNTVLYSDEVEFTTAGTKTCTAYASDSHTANEFSADTEIIEGGIFTDDEIIFDNGMVEFIYDSRNTVPLESLEIIEREDRISPIIKIAEVAKDKTWWEGFFGDDNVGETIHLYWTIKTEGQIYVAEDRTNIPGHIVIIPNNNMLEGYWYDASTNMNYVESYFEVDEDEVRYHVAFPYDEFAANNFTFQTNSLGGLNIESTEFEFEVSPGYTILVSGYDGETGSPVDFNLTAVNGETQEFSGEDSYSLIIPCSLTTMTATSEGYMNTDKRTYLGCVEGDYNISFYQSSLEVNAINIISGNTIADVELNISKDSYYDSSIDADGSNTYYLNTGDYEVNTSKEPYDIETRTGTLTNGENEILNIEMTPTYSTRFIREETGEPFSFIENTEDVSCVDGRVNNTYYEIQYTPDTYECIGNFSEERTCEDGVDAIETTYSQGYLGEIATTYLNYTKPTKALESSYLSVQSSVLPSETYNMSDHLNCFGESVIQFKTESNRPTGILELSCYNGVDWDVIDTLNNEGVLFDMLMNWGYYIEEDNDSTCEESLEMEVTIQTFCDNKVITNVVNSSNQDITGIDCDYKYWMVRADYSTTSYYRMIVPDKDSFDEDIYLLDLNQDAAIEVILYINDISDEYDEGRIQLKKFVNDEKVTVIDQYIDVGNKVVLWLDQNEVYELWSVNNDGEENYEGDLIADSAGERTISLPQLSILPDEDTGKKSVYWNYNANKESGNVTLNYVDLTTGLSELTWNIFNSRSGELVDTQTVITTGNHTLVISNLNSATTYTSELVLDHSYYGEELVSEVKDVWQASATVFPGFGEDGEENERNSNFIKLIIAVSVIIGVMLVFSQATAEIGMTLSLIMMGFFIQIDWFKFLDLTGLRGRVISSVLYGLGGLLAVFMWIKKARKNE